MMAKYVSFHAWVLLLTFVLAILASFQVHAQDQSGFISIDCGSNISYTDYYTDINYVPDADFIDAGESKSIAAQYNITYLQKQYQNVRSFPNGERNCYTLKPPLVDATQYLIRARFMYGNYDSLYKRPIFDLYVGVNLWTTVNVSKYEYDEVLTKEIIQARSSNVTHICLVNKGLGTPFISVLELRLMDSALYPSKTGSLSLRSRVNIGSYASYRYPDDPFDRIWFGHEWSDSVESVYANQSVIANSYKQPSGMMASALMPNSSFDPLGFYMYVDAGAEYYIFMHFAEVQIRTQSQSRAFYVYVNGSYTDTVTVPSSPIAITYQNSLPQSAESYLTYTLRRTSGSTLPPILNALEIYQVNSMQQLDTDPKDAEAINNIKLTYNLKRPSWQGDPCAPQNFTWQGLYCSFGNSQPRIITLNLTSSNLIGEISKYISDLRSLQTLDLSNNSLTGQVPDFLAQMTLLSFINLSGNNLTGVVPSELLKKSKQGSLIFKVDGNPHLCLASPCEGITTPPSPNDSVRRRTKKGISIIPIVASVVGVIVLILVALSVVICLRKKKGNNDLGMEMSADTDDTQPKEAHVVQDETQSINGRFTLSNVLSITNNFSVIIGKGRFGVVYHGYLADTQVAVKMLSRVASHGYKGFKVEEQNLMRIRHDNLVSLVGYCDEGDQMILIYEHLQNGNLASHIYSDINPQCLTWECRLHIALDAARGLEHLHTFRMVHGNLKPSNIFLTEEFQAKLAGFGLSIGGGGTPEYLDPGNHQLNEKSDVFSFGVILLETITSNRPAIATTNGTMSHISEWVTNRLAVHNDIVYIIDPRLEGAFDMKSAWRVVEMAMKCVSVNPNERPTMTRVANELSQCLEIERTRTNIGPSHII